MINSQPNINEALSKPVKRMPSLSRMRPPKKSINKKNIDESVTSREESVVTSRPTKTTFAVDFVRMLSNGENRSVT